MPLAVNCLIIRETVYQWASEAIPNAHGTVISSLGPPRQGRTDPPERQVLHIYSYSL